MHFLSFSKNTKLTKHCITSGFMHFLSFSQTLKKQKPGEPRGAQESPGEPRRAQESPGEPRRAQESPGEPRRAQESPGEPRRAQESPGEPRRAQESPGEPRRAPTKRSKHKNHCRSAAKMHFSEHAQHKRCGLCKKPKTTADPQRKCIFSVPRSNAKNSTNPRRSAAKHDILATHSQV